MLFSLLAFIITSFLLFLSSQALVHHLMKLFNRLTHSPDSSLNLLFFLLLPGIFLHEFSHILAAEILRVQTGHLSLKPQLKNGHLRLGSAQIAVTDPIRLTLIGTAPFVSGTLTLWLLLRFGLNLNLTQLSFTTLSQTTQLPLYLFILVFYFLFAITNTMFSSPSDLQAAGLPIILLLILLGVFNLTNLNLPQSLPQLATNFFSLLTSLFIFILILNLLILLPLKLINRSR